MRVRLQLLAPFEVSKVLVSLPKAINTITDLKKHVRQSLSTVLGLTSSPKDLLLEIDGFELLAGSSVDIIETTDVVTVRLRAGSSKVDLGTRKRESTEVSGHRKKQRSSRTGSSSISNLGRIGPSQPQTTVSRLSAAPSSASSESTTSSSSSDASESSTSTSASPSSSSASSSSSISTPSSSDAVSAAPAQVTTNLPNTSAPLSSNAHASSGFDAQHVIPGTGKTSTRERNRRRKVAHKMKRMAQEAGISSDGPEVQTTVDSRTLNGDQVSTSYSELPIPKAMANRNKKKGFLKEMASVHGTKTVFGDDAQGSSTPLRDQDISVARTMTGPDTSIAPDTSTSQPSRASARVVPPSERVLPSNVFVTHVEYQRKGWTPRQKNAKHREHQDKDHYFNDDEPVDAFDKAAGPQTDLVNGHVDSGMAPESVEQDEPLKGGTEDVWAIAETHFEDLLPLRADSTLAVGSILAWKELTLDPYTFTPQLAVQIGHVKESTGHHVVLERQQRYAEVEGVVSTELDGNIDLALNKLAEGPVEYKIVQ